MSVEVIAAAGVICGETEQFTPRCRQPSLAGEVANLASPSRGESGRICGGWRLSRLGGTWKWHGIYPVFDGFPGSAHRHPDFLIRGRPDLPERDHCPPFQPTRAHRPAELL